jgi:hypothetical protein
MQVIPIQPIPSQKFAVTLANQPCRIWLYTRTTGLYCDLYINDVLAIGGVPCLNTVLIVRDQYLGFVGDLALFDLQGNSDPDWIGLGSRYVLLYLDTWDLP